MISAPVSERKRRSHIENFSWDCLSAPPGVSAGPYLCAVICSVDWCSLQFSYPFVFSSALRCVSFKV